MTWQRKLAIRSHTRNPSAANFARWPADGGSIEAVTKQLELALLIDGALWMGCDSPGSRT